jgi:hypothetical protein
MSSQPTVSVVVPAFNVRRFIGECIQSVRAQTLADWECVVIDDGSTDGTSAAVEAISDARVRLVQQPQQGVSTARNTGLRHASGRYLLFLDGDDLLHRDALARLVAALEQNPGDVAAYGTAWALFEDGAPYPQKPLHRRAFPSGDVLESLMRGQLFILIGTVLVRTACAREIGGFRTDLRLSEDWEFWCRLAAQGAFRFIGLEPQVMSMRIRSASTSRALAPVWQNHLPALRAVMSNRQLASRFGEAKWRRITREMVSAQLWEAGRVNFTARRYAEARRLMMQSLAGAVSAKRLALFAIAQASQLLGRSLTPRLRFMDEDAIR